MVLLLIFLVYVFPIINDIRSGVQCFSSGGQLRLDKITEPFACQQLSGQLGLDKIAEFSAAGHSNELAGNSGYIR